MLSGHPLPLLQCDFLRGNRYLFATMNFTGMKPAIRHVVPWRVVAVTVVSDFRLQVTFVDGTKGAVDLRPFLADSKTTGTVFEALRNPAVFAQVQVSWERCNGRTGPTLRPMPRTT